ncbi:MAG: HAMP domain-containing sensor histidine kinase [Candidatus Korobacteraceae bacterium]
MRIEKAERNTRTPRDGGALVASLAHEVNNPLESLLNLLYLVESEATLTEKGRHYLTLAKAEVLRVAQIAHGAMAEFKNSASPQDTDVPGLLRSVVDFYQPRFGERGISIQARYCSDGDIAVYPGLLRQAFSNLLLNAADSMPAGGTMHARISLAHEWSGQERRGLRVTFADHGGGIASDNLHRIFDLFFTTKGAGGSGLGLSLVKDTVTKHDGVLRVRSSTKQGRSGSIFAMFLPAA